MSEPIEWVDIVFSPDEDRFVEVEHPVGVTINIGEWLERSDGRRVLRLPAVGDVTKVDLRSPAVGEDAVQILQGSTAIVLFINQLNTYSAALIRQPDLDWILFAIERMDDQCVTDNFTLNKALHSLTEKVLKKGMYREQDEGELEDEG